MTTEARPIEFQRRMTIPRSAAEICAEIADVTRWSEFSGYGVLPGIEEAEYEIRTDDMVGSRIRVRNTDGSGHVEEIISWAAGEQITLKLHEFTPPLRRIAKYFTEEWRFRAEGSATEVTRHFKLYPSRSATRPILWLISLLFRRAIARHLAEMAIAD